MTAVRRTTLVLVISIVTALCVLPQAADAAQATARPQLGPLSPAFVEALHDPLVTLGLGRMPSPVEVTVGATAQARAAGVVFPSSYDLRAEGRLTAVKDQGDYSTCWAFANIAALESRLMPADPAPDYSEDNLVGRSGYGPSRDWRYYYGGYDFMAIAYFARWAGPLNEADDPYATWDTYDDPHASGPVQMHVQGVTTIPGRTSPLDNDLVKQLVTENGALSVGMYMDQSRWLDYSTNAYYDPFPDGENHGVTVVGWDDEFPAADFGADSRYTPAGNGAFLVRNTWGEGFGDGGYFWVSYYDRSFAREQSLGGFGGMSSYSAVEEVGNYSRVYQYDKLGVTAHAGYASTRAWGANRFTAAQTQTIAAASFYALASSTRYEVWAGPSFRSLSRRASGTATLPGYLTVRLDKTLRVYKGRQFVVAVKLVSPGEAHPLAIEYPAQSWMRGATAAKGQSYISHNGTAWRDTTTLYARSNVCLKAFAR